MLTKRKYKNLLLYIKQTIHKYKIYCIYLEPNKASYTSIVAAFSR